MDELTLQEVMAARLREHPGHGDQKVHGRRYGLEGTHWGAGTKEDPLVTGNVDVAAWAISNGRYVQLRSKKQVSTLMDKLGEEVQRRRAIGRKAPDFDLCKVSVPKTNLFCSKDKGYYRAEMPQLKGVPLPGSKADKMLKAGKLKLDPAGEVDVTPLFVKELQAKGIGSKMVTVRTDHLKASQRELNGPTVVGIAGAMEGGTFPKNLAPIVITNDDYVLDGHHRWAAGAALALSNPRSRAYRDTTALQIDVPITDGFHLANEFAADIGMPQVSVKQNKFKEVQPPDT